MSIAKTSRAVCASLAIASLAACSGGSTAIAPVVRPTASSAATTSYAGPLATATIALTIPGPSATSASRRRPAYVSAKTRSLKFVLNSSTDLTAAQVTSYNATVLGNFDTGTLPSAACPTQGSGYLCTFTVQLPPGSDSITLTAFDATGQTGNVLSKQIATLVLSAGTANMLAITLDANAATMTLSATASCFSGTVGSTLSDIGTSPLTVFAAFTDPDAQPIAGAGAPKLAILDNTGTYNSTAGTINGTNGTVAFAIDQASSSFTLTPSNASVTGAAVKVESTPANSQSASDGLSFTTGPTSFTFGTGKAAPHSLLAIAEKTSTTGQIAFYTVALGSGSSPDTFGSAPSATLAAANSSNESKPDVDVPQDLAFDSNGDLLIANAGSGSTSGDLACVPAAAVAGSNVAPFTASTQAAKPVALAYDARDGSVAVANGAVGAAYSIGTYTLAGPYTFLAGRSLTNPGSYAALSVATITGPTATYPAGSYAAGLTTGNDNHNGGASQVVLASAGIATATIASSSDPSIDIPQGLAFDGTNNQLVIGSDSFFAAGSYLDFYRVAPVGRANQIGGANNAYSRVATSADGHVAALYAGASEFDIQVYDNTTARNPIGGPIPYNGTSASNGGNYFFDTGTFANGPDGTLVVNQLRWLSNSKLLVALASQATGKQGVYIYSISSTSAQTTTYGYDDQSGVAFAAFPLQTGFQATTLDPLSAAYQP